MTDIDQTRESVRVSGNRLLRLPVRTMSPAYRGHRKHKESAAESTALGQCALPPGNSWQPPRCRSLARDPRPDRAPGANPGRALGHNTHKSRNRDVSRSTAHLSRKMTSALCAAVDRVESRDRK